MHPWGVGMICVGICHGAGGLDSVTLEGLRVLGSSPHTEGEGGGGLGRGKGV